MIHGRDLDNRIDTILCRKRFPYEQTAFLPLQHGYQPGGSRFEDSIPLAINCITVEDVTRELEKRHVIDHKVKQERMQ